MASAEHVTLGIDIGGTSVKAALLRSGRVAQTGRSGAYARPSVDALRAAIAQAIHGMDTRRADACGLCLPGVYDQTTGTITASANIPALVGVHVRALVLSDDPGSPTRSVGVPEAPVVLSDALAAAFDYWSEHRAEMRGRLLAVSLGTGVGAAVLDDGEPLRVNGMSPGHIGQWDVTLEETDANTPIGPDGGRGSLEGYIGLPALKSRFGEGLGTRDPLLSEVDAPLRALARAVRIAHAMYRPEHVVLLGGVGLRLGASLASLRGLVDRDLTRLARPGWTLGVGEHDLHAAIGAARWAARAL